jgi:hypothetical protein
MPIGIIAIKINRIKSIGNFLMFLKGYLNEFDIIFPTSIKPPQLLLIRIAAIPKITKATQKPRINNLIS